MKSFFARLKNAMDYLDDYEKEPFAFKIIVRFVEVLFMIGAALGVAVMFLTVPIWIIPYAIYYCLSKKKGGAE